MLYCTSPNAIPYSRTFVGTLGPKWFRCSYKPPFLNDEAIVTLPRPPLNGACLFRIRCAPPSRPGQPNEMKVRNIWPKIGSVGRALQVPEEWEYKKRCQACPVPRSGDAFSSLPQPLQALSFSIVVARCCVACATSFLRINCVDTSFVLLPWWTNAHFSLSLHRYPRATYYSRH